MCFYYLAYELYWAATDLPGGVRAATAKRGGVTVTRVEIAREGLEKPRGRYVTLEVPSVSVLDERDAEVIEQAADELRALLPPEGPVLVLGVGNRRVTADALGPRTVQKVFVTMGPRTVPVQGLRPVAAVAPAELDPTARLLLRAMVFAARADGHIDATEQDRISKVVAQMAPGQDTNALLGQLLNAPIDPAALAAEIRSAEQGEDLYRLSCMIVDIDHFMERSYLDALAAALKISEARKGQLEEEARQAKAQLAAHAG